jgi:hypothetical protein
MANEGNNWIKALKDFSANEVDVVVGAVNSVVEYLKKVFLRVTKGALPDDNQQGPGFGKKGDDDVPPPPGPGRRRPGVAVHLTGNHPLFEQGADLPREMGDFVNSALNRPAPTNVFTGVDTKILAEFAAAADGKKPLAKGTNPDDLTDQVQVQRLNPNRIPS